MTVTGYTLATVSVLATAASTGIALYSANEQAASQRAIADYNRQIAEQNAQVERNAAIAQAQANQYNAQVALRAADEKDRQSREQAARLRQQRDRLLGLQRSQYAASGVTEQGSPLAVLADTYTQGEMAAVDVRRQGYEEARAQRAAAQYQLDTAMWEEKTAGAGYRIGLRQAQIQQYAGMAQANATQIGGYAAIASGIGSIANTGLSLYGSSSGGGGGGDAGGGTNLRGEFQYATGTVPKAIAVR